MESEIKQEITIKMLLNDDGTPNDTTWEILIGQGLSIRMQLLNGCSIAYYYMSKQTFGELDEESFVLDDEGFEIPQAKRHFTFFRMEVGEA